MAGNCPNRADRDLLIYVSLLSGGLQHAARVKNRGKNISLRVSVLGLAAVLATLAPSAPRADERVRDAVREAVQRGEIHSLADILAAIRGKLPGEIVGMEIERKGSRWLYEFRVVDDKGRLFEVYVDAKTAAIERTKEK